MKKIFCLFPVIMIAVIIRTPAIAQSPLMFRAVKMYDMLAYSEAVPLFEKVLTKDSLNTDALVKLAECYRMTNNLPGQLRLYQKITSAGIGKPIHSLYYAQALMQAGNYGKAKLYLAQFNADNRGVTLTAAINDIDRFFRDSSAYKVSCMPFNSAQNDFSPVVWYNNQVVFTSSREHSSIINHQYAWTNTKFYHLFVTTKNPDGTFTRPKRFAPDLKTRYNDGPLCFSSNQADVYVTRNAVKNKRSMISPDGQIKLRIYRGVIDKNKKGYRPVYEFEYNNEHYNVAHPALSADRKMLFFSSDMPGGFGGMDIYVCLARGDMWSTPVNLGPKVNTAGNEVFPSLKSERYLCFSSNGLAGLGGLDLFETGIDSNGMPSGKVFNLGVPINSQSDDFGITFSSDGQSGYFTSSRYNLDSNDDIFSFVQLKPVKRTVTINGLALDSISREAIAGASITIIQAGGDTAALLVADDKGAFVFEADFDVEYSICAVKEKYVQGTVSVSTKEIDAFEINTELLMLQEPQITLTMLVVDAATQIPLPNVSLTITDKISGRAEQVKTAADGTFKKLLWDNKVGDSIVLALAFSKDGYLNRTGSFRYKIPKPGNIKTTEILNKTELGLDLAKVIQMKPIYFNLGKADIRPDAKIELDKVVQIMKDNPTIYIELGSHTDCRGTAKSNRDLSERRARASVAYIVSKGISGERISGIGYGESKPVNKCECEGKRRVPCTENEHQMNRRTEFLIVKF